MDFQRYFEAFPRNISGAQNVEFVKFSSQAQREALLRMSAILQVSLPLMHGCCIGFLGLISR
jgi:hypothetical protein